MNKHISAVYRLNYDQISLSTFSVSANRAKLTLMRAS